MSDFGDVDPEDAWDDSDTRPDKLGLLVRLVLSIAFEQSHPHDHARLITRLHFGETKAAELNTKPKAYEVPVLAAVILGFFYLAVAEGP